MKKMLALLLILTLIAAGASLAESPAKLKLGYLAPSRSETDRGAAAAGAFAYAAERMGAETVIMLYDPEAEAPAAEGEGSAEPANLATLALATLLENDLDGVAVMPASEEDVAALIEMANAANVPIAIEGVDMRPAHGADDPADLPYAASVCWADSPAYVAAKWLEDEADSPLMFHCALPEADPGIQAGVQRALSGAQYLELANEINARADSVEGGRDAICQMFDSYTMFFCVLADSEALARGCSDELRAQGESMLVAAVASSKDATDLLESGVDMLAGAPASVEGAQTFRALHDYLTADAVPEGEARQILLDVVTATADDSSGWIGGEDAEAAFNLVYPEAAE